MKHGHTITLLVLFTGLFFTALLEARPQSGPAAGYEAREAAWRTQQSMLAASPYTGLKWRSIGPVVQGGRLVDMEVVPGQPYTFYAAYASGGLWKTTNNGHTFEPLFDHQPSMIMGDIAVDPNHPETVWVGTGENNSSRSSYGGMGVFRSDDGGANWRYMGLGDTDRIGRILVDPDDSDTVYVAALGKLYTAGGQRGVFRSRDGGKSWQQVLEGGEWTGAIDLVFKPGDAKTLYAATWERIRRPWEFTEGGKGSAIFKSTDGGDHWTKLQGGLPDGENVGRIGLAVSAASPDTVYASIDNQQPLPEDQWELGDRPVNAKRLRHMSKEEFLAQDKDEIERFIRDSDFDVNVDADTLTGWVKSGKVTIQDIIDELGDANADLFNTDIVGLQVWRSDDAGASWKVTHDGPLDQVVYSYGYYFGQIRVSPANVDEVYVLGVPVVKSGDGGKTWFSVQGRDAHSDNQAMWIDPNYPEHVLIGSDGGADVSYDGGQTWVKVDAQPLGQFYTVNVDMAEPYNVYGGLQDNGTIRCPSNNRWETGANCKFINGGDGMYVAIDPRDNSTVYSGSQFGYYDRQTADGKTAEVRPRRAFGEPALRYNWNTPVILSKHNADVVYFGTDVLYRSMDQGDTWTAISGDLSVSKHRGNVPFATLTTLSESPLQFGLIWAGTDDGQVWVTDSSGVRWQNVSAKMPDRWVSRVEASSHVRERAYVTLNGYRDDDIRAYVYRTDDLGKTFRDISKGLPASPVNVIREDPLEEDILYLGNDNGVYVSTDRGDTWSALQGGLPNVPVHDLMVHPRERELVAGTHGRSIWIVDVLPLQDLVEAGAQMTPLKVFYVDDVQASRGCRGERSRWYFRPEEAPKTTVKYWSDGEGSAAIEIVDANDAVVRRLSNATVHGMNSFDWDLLVDRELALAAESAALQKARDDKDDKDAKDAGVNLAQTPYAEAVRLGQQLYVIPGDYTIRVSIGDNSDSAKLKVKPPRAFEPRARQTYKLRGKKD